MRLQTRLGASILLTLLSLVTIVMLLPNSRVTAGLQVALSKPIDEYASGWWTWVRGGKAGDSIAIVVFGDSWAYGQGEKEKGWKAGDGEGRGRSWASWTCEDLNCTAYISFAASQPSGADSVHSPAGAVTLNQLYSSPPANDVPRPFPDLASQVQGFLMSKPEPPLGKTLFAISIGFWDIYHLAGLDYELAQNMTDAAVDELVTQVHILYMHYTADLNALSASQNETTKSELPPFQLVITRVFDPTLVPGWLTQRSLPSSPSTFAEQQKQAVYLTERWNSRVENALGLWVKGEEAGDGAENSTEVEANRVGTNEGETALPRKYVFHYDLPKYVLDIMVEYQLEDAGQRDASGLGSGKSPFVSVSEPCLGYGLLDQKVERDEVHDAVCTDPGGYLFWDDFNLGGAANEEIGKQIAKVVREEWKMDG